MRRTLSQAARRRALAPVAGIVAAACTLSMALGGCGRAQGGDADTGESASSSDETGPSSSSTRSSAEGSTDASDGPCVGPECPGAEGTRCASLYQDCQDGLKCVPYWVDEDIGGPPTDYKCVTVTGALGPGSSCTLDGFESATDDCDGGSFCWTWANDAFAGRCHPFCEGGFQYAECFDDWSCALPDEDPPMCVQGCSPLADDCPAQTGCLWTLEYEYTCTPEGAALDPGEPCVLFNDCGPGMLCMDAAALAACDAERCCAQHCALSAGDVPCQAIDPDLGCEPAHEALPPGAEDLGICL